jgi:hypothetical protein
MKRKPSTPKQRTAIFTLPPEPNSEREAAANSALQAADQAVKYLKDLIDLQNRYRDEPVMAYYKARNAFNSEYGRQRQQFDDGSAEIIDTPFNHRADD